MLKQLARASLRSGPTCAPRLGRGVDPKVLNYLDVDAIVDTSFPSDCSNSGCSSSIMPLCGHPHVVFLLILWVYCIL